MSDIATYTTELHHAAAGNDRTRVRELIARGADPYAQDSQGRTAFNLAASDGLDTLEYLVQVAFQDTQKEASARNWPAYGINTPSGKYGSTLITYACKACYPPLLEKMLAAGADLSIVNGSGWNLLHAAAVMPGRKNTLELLRGKMPPQAAHAKTTVEYITHYGDQKVVYAAGLTPRELAQARLDQDKYCPGDVRDYLAILE